MKVHPIYTEDNNCQDCYKCVRECPVKAIKIENQKASIINDRCIYCGHCTTICPSDAKKVREDVKTVNYLLEKEETVVAALAPSYKTEFPDWGDSQIIQALSKLGFKHVSETALGAEMVSEAVNNWLSTKESGVYISSCCPVVVDLIHSYYPHIKSNITPVTSPMLAHGKYLKEQFDEDVKVVFVGPCIAKKKEAEKNPGSVDAVITFKKLREWLNKNEIVKQEIVEESRQFFPCKSHAGSVYPIDGGMITSMNQSAGITSDNFMCFSGLENIIELLKNFDELGGDSPVFLELMACSGGCVNGPAASKQGNTALKRQNIINNFKKKSKDTNRALNTKDASLKNTFSYLKQQKTEQYTPDQLTKTLRSFGKYSEKDELNCSGCGYESCSDFAVALLDSIAEPAMCVSYMRKTAQRQASLLLQKMPYAVVMVNDKLEVVESNQSFASLLGDEFEIAFDHTLGLTGMQLQKMLPSSKLFNNLLKSGEELLEKDIKINGKTVHHSIFTIQKNKLVCGILHGFNTPEIVKAEISKRAKQVIRQNLKTVQKIALLLGENASETEGLLNSLVNIENEE